MFDFPPGKKLTAYFGIEKNKINLMMCTVEKITKIVLEWPKRETTALGIINKCGVK